MSSEICIIGDIVVDITLMNESDDKMRLGGILHAARCLWANNINYSIAHFSPEYMEKSINKFSNEYRILDNIKIGNVLGSPYIFYIDEAKEIGNQGYNFILRDEIDINYDDERISNLVDLNFKDILFISGNYSLVRILKYISNQTKIHIDIANNVSDLEYLNQLDRKCYSIFISTSSILFQKYFNDNFEEFATLFEPYTQKLILKENRGGSRAYDFESKRTISIASQTKPITHSVGVGDVYDTTYIIQKEKFSFEESLILSSWTAAAYASTTYPDDFKINVCRINNSDIKSLKDLGGTIVPWEKRKKINIYIAAPDFDFIDSYHIDLLCNSLLYHNFTPRRPIKENGQMEKDASTQRKSELFSKDINLINECNILIAVLLNHDPGTYIEIGIGATKGLPTFIYDPFNTAENCMLTQIPDLISSDLDEIISEVFITSSKIAK